ncbi:MAG: penicillin-binding protein 1C [Bacteroidota bacterium]
MLSFSKKIINYFSFKSHPKRLIILLSTSFLFGFYWFSLPSRLFNVPKSTVIYDSKGNLLSARLASDAQWRFPINEKISDKFKVAIINFEDQYFQYHPGFNPVSIVKALYKDIKKRRIVSGGSTITMQVIRSYQKNPRRTFWNKLKELILSTRLELTYSKDEILSLYASNVPFGGNIVGIEAASWRYYNKPSEQLSWAEAATLAVLPNSPSLIFPGKNHQKLLSKRNKLLSKLYKKGYFDAFTYDLAKNEPLPGKPKPFPDITPHLMLRAFKDGKEGTKIISSIDLIMQQRVKEILSYHQSLLKASDVNNAACLVLDIETGKVLTYIGNLDEKGNAHENYVDIIDAPRSSGSILKPLLYAASMQDGLILQNTLLPDVPIQIGGFNPQNFNKTNDGAVPASQAVSRSLNIPSVLLLKKFGIPKFYSLLKLLGVTTLTKPSSHYGLSLIIGGSEVKLWDIAGIYASLARQVLHYPFLNSMYDKSDFFLPKYEFTEKSKTQISKYSIIGAGATWKMMEAMNEVERPLEDNQWREFSSASRIAWKTGTSYGYRDAWSIGFNGKFLVAVWVGNASGEGRPGLTGVSAAAPIMFDVFSSIQNSKWFNPPFDDMVKAPVCRESGCKASNNCPNIDTVWIPIAGLNTEVCNYHHIINLDKTGKWRVNSDCYPVSEMIQTPWFILPPAQEWFFKTKNSWYRELPPYLSSCESFSFGVSMQMIYPANNSKIYIPIELDEKKGRSVFKVAHRRSNATIYWHIDDEYIGTTTNFHELAVNPKPGKHKLILVDDLGESISVKFESLGK